MPSTFKSSSSSFHSTGIINIHIARTYTEITVNALRFVCVVGGFNSKSFVHKFGDSGHVLMMSNNMIHLIPKWNVFFIQNGQRACKLASNCNDTRS